jgi:peptidoglycan/LPS O-acetylase OafA/YrhL
LKREPFRRDIQALRGIAVLAVVAYHFSPKIFPQGYLGVDSFFVISGFVITPMIYQIVCAQDQHRLFQELKIFYRRRFYRLTPALVVTLLGSLIALTLFASSADLKKSGLQALYTVAFAGNIGAFRLAGDYFHNNGNPLIHTWSLSIEEQIYFILPAIFVLLYFIRKKTRKIFFAVIFILSFISFLSWIDLIDTGSVYSELGIRDLESFSFYSPIERFWQFGIGGVCFGILMKYPKSLLAKNKKIYLFLLALLVAFMTGLTWRNGNADTITVVLIICVLLLCNPKVLFNSMLPSSIVGIGNRSYSIYLVHMPIVYLSINSPYLDSNNPIVQFFVSMAGLAITFFLAEVLFRNVENRFRMKSQSESEPLKKRNLILLGTSGLLVALASFMVLGEKNSYFGLQEDLPQVAAAWDGDPNCARMAEWDGVPCLYPISDAEKTLILIGDSHAAQLSEVILNAGQAENWNVVIWTMAGCAVVFEKTTSQISNDCLIHNKRTLDWIKRKKPNLVVISQYNGIFLPQREIRSAVLTIKRLVPNVHLVGNTPVFPDRRYMTHGALFQAPYEFKSEIPVSDMDRSNVDVSERFLAWGKENGVSSSDLSPLYCTPSHCTRSNQGTLLFSDRDHLSVDGANLALQEFRLVLKKFSDQ